MWTILIILWIFWELKYILFWLYLWQLKEYHIRRFLGHFDTNKGKKLLFNFPQILKIAILLLLVFSSRFSDFLIFIASFIYFVETIIFFRQIAGRSFKKPVFTFKAVFLATISLLLLAVFVAQGAVLDKLAQAPRILIFDILTPFIISAIVLLFQPFFATATKIILQKAKQKLQKFKNLKIIAITGSYGKTSTKEFLATILSSKFKVLSTTKNQNSEIAVANCILKNLKPSHEIFIAEVGAYDKGKVKEVSEMIGPKIGIVTGVNEQHLSLFGSMENLLSAEGGKELAQVLGKDGTLVTNGENKYCLDLYKNFGGHKKIYCAKNNKLDADIWADEITANKESVLFVAIDKSKQMAHFNVRVLGKQNIQNLLAAILTARELGMNMAEIAEACKEIRPWQAGMVLKHGNHGIEVVDSSYSSNPDGVMADLNYLSIFGTKKAIVMSCLIELGEKSAEIHKKIGKKIGEVCDLAVITSKDKFDEIKKGAMETGMAERNILLCDKPEDIYSVITLMCKQGDAALLEGRVPSELIKLLTK